MKTKFIVLFILIANTIYAQKLEWALSISGASYEYGVDVEVDSEGNIFTTGYSLGSIIIADTTINPVPNGRGDAFISKQNPDGEIIWIKTFGCDSDIYFDDVNRIHIDKYNDVYILATVRGENFHYDFDTIPGISGPAQYGGRAILLKCDEDGNLLWWEHENIISFQSLTTDSYGNIYLTGYFDGEGKIGGQTLTNTTYGTTTDMFIAKLSKEGILKWVKHVGGKSSNTFVYGIDLDLSPSQKSIYLTGQLRYGAYFNTDTIIPSNTVASFIAKYDTTGNEIWVKAIDSIEYFTVSAVDVSSDEQVGIVGYYYDYWTDDASFVHIYDSTGKTALSYSIKSDSKNRLFDIKFNPMGDYYLSGYLKDNFYYKDFSYEIQGSNNYILKVQNDSELAWMYEFNNTEWSSSICLDSASILFTNRLDYSNNFENASINPISGDAIILRILDCMKSYSAETVSVCEQFISPTGKTWTSSGTYMDTLVNIAGCDSIITFDLTINQSSTAVMNENACNSYTAPSGKILSSSGTYLDTLVNTSGCDSIIAIDLTINQSSTSVINENACKSYTAPSGEIWTSSGTYIDTIVNSTGCDSIITINLTMDCSDIVSNLSTLPVSVYPNPTNSNINIDFDRNHEIILLEVIYLDGSLFEKKSYQNSSQIQYQINGPEGVYMIKVTDDQGNSATMRIMKK